MGAEATPLKGGPRYELAVRPQQIVTLRFMTGDEVATPPPLLDWSPLVPPA